MGTVREAEPHVSGACAARSGSGGDDQGPVNAGRTCARAGQGVKRGTGSSVQDIDRRGRAGAASAAACTIPAALDDTARRGELPAGAWAPGGERRVRNKK